MRKIKIKTFQTGMKRVKWIRNSAQSDFMGECISKEMNAGVKQDQAIAICHSKWNEKINAEKINNNK